MTSDATKQDHTKHNEGMNPCSLRRTRKRTLNHPMKPHKSSSITHCERKNLHMKLLMAAIITVTATSVAYATNEHLPTKTAKPTHVHVDTRTSNQNKNTNQSRSSSVAKQSSTQKQSSVSDSRSNSTSAASTNDSNNASQSVNYKAARNPVASANAPAIITGYDCGKGYGVGAQGSGFGVSLGGTTASEECERRADSAHASNMGDTATAEEIMCESTRYRAARERSGRACAPIQVRAEEAKVYSGTDPIVRARLGMPELRN